MSSIKILDMQGADAGEYEVGDDLLVSNKGAQALYEVVIAHRAAQRAGTASTLSKGEVAGSNKKPWRQKGTGRARAGYRQSPVWRGGGVAFGPHPRDYGVKMNRKVSKLAFRRALTERIQGGEVIALDALTFEEPKTKHFVELMEKLKVQAPVLFIVDKLETNVALAARNLERVEVVCASDVNTYQLVRYPALVITKSAMPLLERRLGREQEVSAA